MIKKLQRATRCMVVGSLIPIAATAAFAQAPTEAQREAIKTDCRSDYIAHCSSIPPGGEASLQCLQKNMSSLSGSCQAAVRAVEAPPAAAAPAPAAPSSAATKSAAPAATKSAAPTPAATAPAKQPSSAQIAAVRAACQSDYPKVCAGVSPGGAPALQCLAKNKAKVSANCQQAVNAATGGAAAPAATATAAPGAAAAAPAPAPLVLRPMRPREELFVMRSACGADVQTLCNGVAPGGGRIMQCLAVRGASLSPACRDVLAQFAAQ